jgi:RNA polymerase sigma-70 factor (ECF subfamily)
MHRDSVWKTRHTLLERLKGGSGADAAWAEFVNDYHRIVYSYCRRRGLGHQDAEDVTQNVFLRVHRYLERYDPARGKFRFWLGAISLHAVRDWLRGRRPFRPGGDDVERLLDNLEARADLAQTLAEEFDQELLQQALERVREQFDPRAVSAFELQTRDGLSGQEAADRLGMNRSTAFSHKRRVLAALRKEVLRLTESEGEGHDLL